MRILRALILAVAIVAAAWFALGLRQAVDLSRATAIVTGSATLSPSQAARAGSLLHTAGDLNPDRQVKLVQADLAIRDGHPAAARQILDSVLRAEPDNLVGWDLLAIISGNDPRTLLEAYHHIAELHHNPRG